MKFREAIDGIEGLRLLYDITPVVSPLGRAAILESEFIHDSAELDRGLQEVETAVKMLSRQELSPTVERLSRALMQARDISSTLTRLEGNVTLDDVELFEVKGLAITAEEVRAALAGTPLESVGSVVPPELQEVVEELDPEHTGSRHFHIYNAYSDELAARRRELEDVRRRHLTESEIKLLTDCIELENKIRARLSALLYCYVPSLMTALECLRRLDLLMAKARLAIDLNLSRPRIESDGTLLSYEGLRYLPVERMLEGLKRKFQPVDITLREGTTLITGANMGGKTITLRSVAMAQAMAQFGYYVPARKAILTPVYRIQLSMGDRQSVLTGLSSFGAEIIKIDEIVKFSRLGNRYLNLIDEPARTTNPEEGRAIVEAVVELLGDAESFSLITTHYSGVEGAGRRYRVKGLREGAIPAHISPSRLGEIMDYTLELHDDTDVGRDALRIARMLSISPAFARSIESHLSPPLQS